LGTENSAGLGEAAVACGGLCWAALPPEVNLDEMLVNQELRRCGVGVEGGVPFSSELVLAEFDRVSVACFPCSVWLPLVAGDEGGLGAGAGVGTEAGAGEGESRPPELDSDRVREIAFLATLSLGFPCVIQLTSRL